MRYARIDKETHQMISSPRILPQRWITPTGVTINHFNKLSRSVLFALTWVPVIYEELTPGTVLCSPPVYDEVNRQLVYEAVPEDFNNLLRESEQRINEAASFACMKYISQGVGQDCRYMVKREQAINYLDDIIPILADYPMIKRESEESGMAPGALAQLIVTTANEWIILGAEIEALRCGGKKKCRNAENNKEMIQYRNEAIAALGLV